MILKKSFREVLALLILKSFEIEIRFIHYHQSGVNLWRRQVIAKVYTRMSNSDPKRPLTHCVLSAMYFFRKLPNFKTHPILKIIFGANHGSWMIDIR